MVVVLVLGLALVLVVLVLVMLMVVGSVDLELTVGPSEQDSARDQIGHAHECALRPPASALFSREHVALPFRRCHIIFFSLVLSVCALSTDRKLLLGHAVPVCAVGREGALLPDLGPPPACQPRDHRQPHDCTHCAIDRVVREVLVRQAGLSNPLTAVARVARQVPGGGSRGGGGGGGTVVVRMVETEASLLCLMVSFSVR